MHETLVQITTHQAAASLLFKSIESQVLQNLRRSGYTSNPYGAMLIAAASLNWTALDLMRAVYRNRHLLMGTEDPYPDGGGIGDLLELALKRGRMASGEEAEASHRQPR